MALQTGKVRPVDRSNLEGTVQQLCTQFALLVDEVGYELSKERSAAAQEAAALQKELEEVKSRLSALEGAS